MHAALVAQLEERWTSTLHKSCLSIGREFEPRRGYFCTRGPARERRKRGGRKGAAGGRKGNAQMFFGGETPRYREKYVIKLSRKEKNGNQKQRGTRGAKRREIPAAKPIRETFVERYKGD